MKAEIVEGELIIYPETTTELYALNMLQKNAPEQIVKVNTVDVDTSVYVGEL